MRNVSLTHKKLLKHPVFILICVAVIVWGILAYIELIESVYNIGIQIGEALAR
jgi:hypothetical protein